MVRHIVISAALFALEVVLGVGLLGMGIGLMMMLVALASAVGSSGRRRHHFGVAVIYALLCISTMGVIQSNWRVAQNRAVPLIAAIEHFHSDRGRYPSALEELCPSYLPSIPRGGFTLVGRRYGYIADRPQLYFAAMFHGVVSYDFPTHKWMTNE
jgi:hypothetical protein